MVSIAQSPDTTPNVKAFIEALMCDDETKLLKLDTDTSNEFVLTCINNHQLHNNDDKKIRNYKQKCSVCGDSGHGSNWQQNYLRFQMFELCMF